MRRERVSLSLKITEIYPSIQGESSFAGYPCTFIRLTGCPLRCRWCDTVYSFEGGEDVSIASVMERVAACKLPMVELTGGEPLAQPGCIDLAKALVAAGYKVLIETSGSYPVVDLPKEVHIVMDVKCPDSKMDHHNRLENFGELKSSDDVKFVLASRSDYDWANEFVETHRLADRFQVLYSCAFGLLAPKDLAEWMTEDVSVARLQLQQHKYIWHPRQKGV